MNKYLLIIFFLIFFQSELKSKEIIGKPIIHDGDSIKINNEKIRFSDIDAFEKKQTCKKNEIKYKCGEEAIKNLSTIISNQKIRCVTKKKDPYKRWLATCYIGKLNINENMVLFGNAFSYMSKKYKNTENDAKKVKAGAWSGEFIFPWEWRKLKKNNFSR